jgi:mono/diheme cytochrome c family protein
MLPDGRVLFTRWEYIDRDLTYRQSLWTQNPDGRHYQLFFGNTVRSVGMFWQARPVPGHRNLVVATFAPHHAWPHGAIGLIQNRLGLEAPRDRGYSWITQEFPEIRDLSFRWSYRDPFPVGDHQFLVAYGGGAGDSGRFALYLLDLCDNKQPVYRDPQQGCYGPLPLRPRKVPPRLAALEHQQQSAGDEAQWGTVLVADVYRGLPGIERGRVKQIQIMEQMRKTADLTSREIYFQVLDAEGRELQRMTSAMQLMPGETQTCIGCHEPRNMAPFPKSEQMPAAFRRPPSRPEPPAWGNRGIVDFVKVVQPVLDEYCVECHSGADPDGGYDLSGDETRLFNMAYDNLLGRSRSYRQHDMDSGEMLPEEAAKGRPLVHFYWLLRTPTAVNRPLWTGSHASRLLEYIETDHCGRMIPPTDRQRIYLWIDANVPYYATYAHSRPRSPGYRDLCTDVQTGRESEWYAKRFLGVYKRRCESCHGGIPHPNDHGRIWDGRLAWINFSHPEHSPALTAHLAKPSGGRGLGTEDGGKGPPLWKDTGNADYLTMLRAIREGRQKMLAHPRVDMQPATP